MFIFFGPRVLFGSKTSATIVCKLFCLIFNVMQLDVLYSERRSLTCDHSFLDSVHVLWHISLSRCPRCHIEVVVHRMLAESCVFLADSYPHNWHVQQHVLLE